MAIPRSTSVRVVQKLTDGKGELPLCVLSFKEGQTLADFRLKLSTVCDFEFDYWDDRLPGPVRAGVEKLTELGDLDGTVFIVEKGDSLPLGRVGIISSQSSAPTVTETTVGSEEQPPSDVPLHTGSFESRLMSIDARNEWHNGFVRLKKWVVKEGKADFKWKVRTWDEGDVVRAQLECLECKLHYGAVDGAQDVRRVANVFSNFKSKHFEGTRHQAAYYKNRGLPFSSLRNPDGKAPVVFDHGKAISYGFEIVEKLNVECRGARETLFSVHPGEITPEYEARSSLFKVSCVVCRKLHTDLCPKKQNLEHNLRTHLSSRDHILADETAEVAFSLEERVRKRGRPKKPDGRDLHVSQNSLLKWVTVDNSQAGSSSGKGMFDAIDLESDIGLSLLCWGYWKTTIQWKKDGPHYNVKGILDDQMGGVVWDLESCCKADVFNPTSASVVAIRGCFRHHDCCRLSILGGGFKDLMCSACKSITKQDDFRGRVHREGEAIVQRGNRTTKEGIRLGFLTNTELRSQVHSLNAVRRKERWLLAVQAQIVCALRMRKRKLEEMLGVASDRKDLKLFLKSIVTGHQNGAFGGKEGLWDFLKDVARNLERKPQGFRYSARTKAIAQAMLQFGGRQVAHCFARNLGGPGIKTLKRDQAKLPQFRTGLRPDIFKEVGRVLALAKETHGITGDVPVMFAEDETRIKERPRWEAKYDTLIGFCGPSEDHVCSYGLEVVVGEGQEGYDKIVHTFEKYTKCQYARVVIVNPLHECLPKLALCAIGTCNKFDSEWVRQQWIQMKALWDEHCRADVGPVIGHASDGDARRRKLMLEDYRSQNGSRPRYSIGWEGWQFSVAILENGDLYGFGDQDQPHNGKKLINPLDRVSSKLMLGTELVSLSHVCAVYNHYSIHEHGLNWDDVNRTDRQNWAGPQRIAARRVSKCLQDLQVRHDKYHDRSLGTEMYLEICGDYIDIFFSKKHDLRTRVVLAAKVSGFFRLWRLWLRFGDHSVGGNVLKYTEKDMISIQAFHDVNMSCNFIVLLICAFRDKFPHLAVPFDQLGSDCCEIFFSKVGGMSGHERNYDFGSLLDCCVGVNRLVALEYGPEGLKIGRSHKKQDHVWGKIHPLLEGEEAPDLKDYSLVSSNELVVAALKEGFDAARHVLSRLQMSPRASLPAARKRWWTHPWVVEAETWPSTIVLSEAGSLDDSEDHLDHCPPIPTTGRPTGECSEMEDPEKDLNRVDAWMIDEPDRNAAAEDIEDSDGSRNEIEVLGHEVRHVMSSVVQDVTSWRMACRRVVATVIWEGRIIYKSTLVSELVGNPDLSKDRLPRMRQGLYISGKRKVGDLDPNGQYAFVGTDCAVVFEAAEESVPETRSSRPSKGNRSRKDPVQEPQPPRKEIWIGRIVSMKMKYGTQWGKCWGPVDLLNRPASAPNVAVCQFRFNWYKPIGRSRTEFTFDVTDPQDIDLDNVISTVNLSLKHGIHHIFVLDAEGRSLLDQYLQTIGQ